MILAADEVTPRAGQEGHEARDILGPAKPPDGNLGGELLLCLSIGIALPEKLGGDHAGVNDVGEDSLLCVVPAQVGLHPGHPRLGGRVGDGPASAVEHRAGADEDDAAMPPGQHVRDRGAHGVICSVEVERHCLLPLPVGLGLHGARGVHSRVAHKDVDGAPLRRHRVRQAAHRGPVAGVRCLRTRPAPLAADAGKELPDLRGALRVSRVGEDGERSGAAEVLDD